SRLFRDALEGKFKTVLVYKIDRIGRDNLVTLEAVFKLTKLGIDIKSMTELSDRSNPQGRFIFNLFANLAEWEKEQIRERTIDGKYRKARSGRFPGGIIPYGYFLNKEKFLEINETPIPGFSLSPSELVKHVFNWIGKEGMSTIAVAKRLNTLGIPPTKCNGKLASANGKWRHDRIRKTVVNTVYIGTYEYGKRKSRSDNIREKVSISIPSIIDEELWFKAQETLRRNRKFAKRNSKHLYLLKGLLKCNFCGHKYSGWSENMGTRYYRCYGRVGHYKMVYGECRWKGKKVRADWIEGVVWDEIKSWILNPVTLEEIISEKLKEYQREKGNSFKMYSKLRDSIEKKREERTRILELYRKGIITFDDVQKQLEAVESEETHLIKMGEELKSKMVDGLSQEELTKWFREEIDKYGDQLENGSIVFEDKQRLVQTLVREVRVNMNGRKVSHPSLIETIPFRKEIEPISSKDASIATIYSRDKNDNERELQSDYSTNFADVIYHFPFPPKELSATVNSIPR
ncbi:MAG: recombinase family protein, partial [Ignavibacteriales bacterium]